METKSDYIRARVEPKLKIHVDNVLKQIGVTPTQVITMLYKLIEREKRIPFDLYATPNRATARAIKEARAGKGLIECKDADDMFDKLGI